jgi:hypothetical protein
MIHLGLRAPVFAMTPLYRSARVAAVLLVVALAASACVAPSSALTPSSGPWQLSGTVSNLTGRRIAGARVVVMDGPNKDVQVTTDAEGRFFFANLENGAFDLLIEALGFTSIRPRVNLFRDIEANFGLSDAS